MMRPALFLDRDGVIIENRPNYVRTWDDVQWLDSAVRALARIHALPHAIVLVTNQSGVGRGLIPRATADEINRRVVAHITACGGRVDAVYMCPHAPVDLCDCRKPQPGMLLQAAADLDLDLSQSIMIGDALTDIAAGRNAGVRHTALLETGRGATQHRLPAAAAYQPLTVYPDLEAALQSLLT